MKQRPLGMLCILIILIQLLLVGTGMRKSTSAPPTWKEGDSILVLGRVYRKEMRSEYQILYLQDAEVLHQNSETVKLNLIVYDQNFQQVSIGNILFVAGNCALFQKPGNPGNYDQDFYYKKQNLALIVFAEKVQVQKPEVWKLRNCLDRIRNRWHQMLVEVLGEKNGGMLSAMLTGEKRDLDAKWKEIYQVNGIAHILAISGLHISFIGLAFYQGLRKIGCSYQAAGVAGAVFLILYAMMTGMSVSTMRAMIMFVLRIGADMSGRVYDMMTALLLSASVILIRNPLYAFDAGFLLSFGAIFGILLLLPFFKLLVPWKSRLLEGFCASMAIQIFLFPITLYFFFEIPLYSILLNVVVIPLMSLVLGAGLVGTAVYVAAPWIGQWILKGTGCIFALYEVLCELGMRLPCARRVIGKPKWQQVVLYYGILSAFMMWIKKRFEEENTGMQSRGIRAGVLLCLILLAIAAVPWKWNRGRIQVTMLDVGQGDGIYMRGPSGIHYFIDGGSSDVNGVGKYRIESFLKSQGVWKLDYVFLSHGDEDHISGVKEMLARQELGIKIQALVLPVQEVWDESLKEMAETARENGTRVVTMESGQRLNEDEFSIECLQPGDEELEPGNEASMVLQIKYKEFDMLFTGDVEGKGEKILTSHERLLKVDVLKVAHHGSQNSTKEEFLERTRPQMAWISAGTDNPYGHPDEETLRRLEKNKIAIYNTQHSGAVTIVTDGKKMKIQEYIER